MKNLDTLKILGYGLNEEKTSIQLTEWNDTAPIDEKYITKIFPGSTTISMEVIKAATKDSLMAEEHYIERVVKANIPEGANAIIVNNDEEIDVRTFDIIGRFAGFKQYFSAQYCIVKDYEMGKK